MWHIFTLETREDPCTLQSTGGLLIAELRAQLEVVRPSIPTTERNTTKQNK